ncbi:hypothetical protein JOF56_009341 [Kibdelosporangium banguiense]|uniref:Uncharacterized protein n=1 Tax=Kibdelosporangium banguiense TaxID=1365924 RepID=A0ABS4TX60_9PSEU|nr:hypothetical protein [Kibdelosporangium banguiense]
MIWAQVLEARTGSASELPCLRDGRVAVTGIDFALRRDGQLSMLM